MLTLSSLKQYHLLSSNDFIQLQQCPWLAVPLCTSTAYNSYTNGPCFRYFLINCQFFCYNSWSYFYFYCQSFWVWSCFFCSQDYIDSLVDSTSLQGVEGEEGTISKGGGRGIVGIGFVVVVRDGQQQGAFVMGYYQIFMLYFQITFSSLITLFSYLIVPFSALLYEVTPFPFTKNKSSFISSFSFFFFRISAKKLFVLADGLVFVLPATEGTLLFFKNGTLPYLLEATLLIAGLLLIPLECTLLKYPEESSSNLLGILSYPSIQSLKFNTKGNSTLSLIFSLSIVKQLKVNLCKIIFRREGIFMNLAPLSALVFCPQLLQSYKLFSSNIYGLRYLCNPSYNLPLYTFSQIFFTVIIRSWKFYYRTDSLRQL